MIGQFLTIQGLLHLLYQDLRNPANSCSKP